MLTKGKIETTRFDSTNGNPFAALAREVHKADVRHAQGRQRTKAAREANARNKRNA